MKTVTAQPYSIEFERNQKTISRTLKRFKNEERHSYSRHTRHPFDRFWIYFSDEKTPNLLKNSIPKYQHFFALGAQECLQLYLAYNIYIFMYVYQYIYTNDPRAFLH